MELIHIENREIDGAVEQTVNARELHNSLGVKKDFSDWIKPKLDNGFLKKGRDFIVFHQKGENLKGGRPGTEYILTLDTAKHIAMMSRTQKAYEIREYFIEVEKRYNQINRQELGSMQKQIDALFDRVIEIGQSRQNKVLSSPHSANNLYFEKIETGLYRVDGSYYIKDLDLAEVMGYVNLHSIRKLKIEMLL